MKDDSRCRAANLIGEWTFARPDGIKPSALALSQSSSLLQRVTPRPSHRSSIDELTRDSGHLVEDVLWAGARAFQSAVAVVGRFEPVHVGRGESGHDLLEKAAIRE